ncbi:MAG: RluA family pseudouridine synthase [Proteobacteria bacterium]|nr:RluA family pseudouridine synthase [Pseudomonadota bacterium]MBU1686662.1 RluA family pseudouridine synthase [Pseudomonadota bacterium]
MPSIDGNSVAQRDNDQLFRFVVSLKSSGQRLDQFLVHGPTEHGCSRTRIHELVRSGLILVNGRSVKSSYRICSDDHIELRVPMAKTLDLIPEKVDFEILFEDDDLLVISKPPGLVVHPACGHQEGTLVHGLLFHCDDLSGINGLERPGIVHRLDKDTSGVMVVAKNDFAHQSLTAQFKDRTIVKKYRAVIEGCPERKTGEILLAIGRHPTHRRKMAVCDGGRAAYTAWTVLEAFASGFSYLDIGIGTGRTHQIRVHLASIGYPVAGDELYGKRKGDRYGALGIVRQCLHSSSLAFDHPRSLKRLEFTASLWPDIANILAILRGETLVELSVK